MKKTIIVGVSGGIAAFKSVQLVSDLVKKGYDVEVIMSKNACEFIQPLSFEALTNHSVMIETFDQRFEKSTQHISIAKRADLFIIVPATANVLAKVVHGIADDMLTTTFLACTCPKLIALGMNTNMLNNPITQSNIKLAKEYDIHIIESKVGYLACGDIGAGKLADLDVLMNAIEASLQDSHELAGKKILISAGATIEPIDPVRFISNHSSGKMGIALAKQAKAMGGEVTLICGKLTVDKPQGIKCVDAFNALSMYDEVTTRFNDCDILIMAAAISDYRVKDIADHKIKKNQETMMIELIKNPDILAKCGELKTHQTLIGFAMESENLIENARTKCIKKNCDFIVANNIKEEGAGFMGDTNIISLINQSQVKSYTLLSKDECAKVILTHSLDKGANLC